jgi:uncharacterized protein YbaP (TraB family)
MKTTQIKSTIALIFFGLYVGQLHGQALLWEISSNGLSEKSYLFGSIHIQDKRVFQMDSVVWNRFEQSASFAMEFDVNKANKRQAAARMKMSKSYAKLLPNEDFQLLKKTVEECTKIPFIMVWRMKPFFISSLISQSVLTKDEKDPMDVYFLEKARKAKKTILELESFEEQINAIDKTPLNEQLESLVKLIHNPDLQASLRAGSELLISAYLTQDDTHLYQLILESDQNETFLRQFFTERNYNMLKKIQTFAANGSTFIVVGAGHLAGDEGLVSLLQKEGYTLTPVRFN